MKLTLKGIPSPKKNSRNIFRTASGKIVNIPSKNFAAWHDRVWMDMPQHIPRTPEPCSVTVAYYFPDRRRRDLSNLTESIMDLLVDRRVLSDDSWGCVPCVTMLSMGIDKENPRTEIEIHAIQGNRQTTIFSPFLRILRMFKRVWREGNTATSQAV